MRQVRQRQEPDGEEPRRYLGAEGREGRYGMKTYTVTKYGPDDYAALDHMSKAEVAALLENLEGREENHAFDFIFMDPPYNHQYEQQVLKYLRDSKLADPSTIVIIEASKETDIDWISSSGWQIDRIKMYKTNQHIFTIKGE